MDSDSGGLDGLRVLVADDSADNLFLTARMLQGSGALVSTVSNGQEAVNLVKTSEFDVVLMDLQMPVMNGYEALKELRKMGFTGPVLALTAHALSEERRVTREFGFSDHLAKPVSRLHLLDALRKARESTPA
jgi:CheY-like chemotaxis protein